MNDDQITHHHFRDFSIFPPINHEDLPVNHAPPLPHSPPHAPPSFGSNDLKSSSSPPLPPKCRKNLTQLIKWFDFALHFWNSKLVSFLTRFHVHGVFSSFCSVVATASFLGFVWCWLSPRWRMKRMVVSGGGGGDSVEQLKALVKAKDEKIIQLLEQIAEMNKVLLARCRFPVSKGS
ncbi:hypothetical protein KSS87_006251 [Heliosperma pusillum]|nr:hypothetical protein KSS87_006251 [Heliosperma pusillum]